MRTPHFILLALVSLVSIEIGHASLVQSGFLFEEFRSYEGTLVHSADKSKLYVVSADSKVTLDFTYDEIEDFVITDIGQVTVSGYYSRFHSVLQVEEIMPMSRTFL